MDDTWASCGGFEGLGDYGAGRLGVILVVAMAAYYDDLIALGTHKTQDVGVPAGREAAV